MSNLQLYLDNLVNRNRYLADLNSRIDHFKLIQPGTSQRAIDGAGDEAQDDFTVPEVDASELTVDVLKRAIRSHGCLIVRNYFDKTETAELRDYVEYAFKVNDNRDKAVNKYVTKQVSLAEVLEHTKEDIARNSTTNPTYQDTTKIARNLAQSMSNSVMHLTVKTPMIARKVMQMYDRKGLKRMLDQYFEHGACISCYKWVLRRATSPKQPVDYHQDGAFMGEDIDSMNLWVALSDCGGGHDAPGMDIVPKRMMGDFAKGSGVMDWTIGPQAVVDGFGDQGVVTPTFNEGDGFFFDHLLVHRTQHIPDNTNLRYAIETWFFDMVNFPKNQIPLRW